MTDTQSSASCQHYIDTGEYLPGCHVTLTTNPGHTKGTRGGGERPRCGRPVVAHGLCEQHYADRIRLGGTA